MNPDAMENAAVARLEERMNSFEKENDRRNNEMQRAIDALGLEQREAYKREHARDLEYTEMKNDVKTILEYISGINPRRKAILNVSLVAVGLLFSAIQVYAMFKNNQIAATMVEISRSLPK
jgi:hypothetical protein